MSLGGSLSLCVGGLFLAGLSEISQLCNTSLPKPVIETGDAVCQSLTPDCPLQRALNLVSKKGCLGYCLSLGLSSQGHREERFGVSTTYSLPFDSFSRYSGLIWAQEFGRKNITGSGNLNN